MFTFGVIPARGGSKRYPRKNIAPCYGKPLIAWSIASARESDLTETIVSTDDAEIAEVAEAHGGSIPFLRPPELGQDTTSSFEVLIHAAQWCERTLQKPDYIILLQPTSPTRTASDINLLLKVLEHQRPKRLVSVTADGCPDGLFYAFTYESLLETRDIRHLLGAEADPRECVRWYTNRPVPDIDIPDDMKAAEYELNKRMTSPIPREGVNIDY